MRFGLRSLFIAITVAAVSFAGVVAPYHRRARIIAEWRKRDVCLLTEYGGPSALDFWGCKSSLFAGPVRGALVRIQGVDETTVRYLGRSIVVEDLRESLTELQDELQVKFGLTCFALVLDKPFISGTISSELGRLQVRGRPRLRFIETPCGADNFR